nr:MAG TPA: hypothetical protein [Caudoviricetes sp.]
MSNLYSICIPHSLVLNHSSLPYLSMLIYTKCCFILYNILFH